MKAVMISVQPKWCELIASGKKTIVVRKTRPKIDTPFKCYVYCTFGKGLIEYNDEILPNVLLEQNVDKSHIWGNCCNGKVIGEFVCDKINYITADIINGTKHLGNIFGLNTCLTDEELFDYIYCGKGKENCGRGWHISDLKIYDKPKELGEFFYLECTDDSRCDTCPSREYLGYEYEDTCATDGYRRVTRPPQSWCYVEELAHD